MRFLADECCDFAAVRCLRADGHDVLVVSEFQHQSVDKEVLDMALSDNRILLTEDKDFGWLVFAARLESPGVILIRFPLPLGACLPGLFRNSSASMLQGCPELSLSSNLEWRVSALVLDILKLNCSLMRQ